MSSSMQVSTSYTFEQMLRMSAMNIAHLSVPSTLQGLLSVAKHLLLTYVVIYICQKSDRLHLEIQT